MFFKIFSEKPSRISSARSQAFLVVDGWNDWFEYSTMYTLYYYDKDGIEHPIGSVKIGEYGLGSGRAAIPDEFDFLKNNFFSLGQDDSYYERLNSLGEEVRDKILIGLRDVARDLDTFNQALRERVTGRSLLRYVTSATVRGQFHRMAHGGARLSRYEFSYTGPEHKAGSTVKLTFEVEPESQPPTNVHVLIGRNAVGKTRFLNLMTQALVDESATPESVGFFTLMKVLLRVYFLILYQLPLVPSMSLNRYRLNKISLLESTTFI